MFESKTMKPSNIFYSQNSIRSTFRGSRIIGRWRRRIRTITGDNIGYCLDRLCSENLSVNDFPHIQITQRPDDARWFTLDNRRLWIFHHLEATGKCDQIPVEIVEYKPDIHKRKFTGSGHSVSVIGTIEGIWYSRVSPVTPRCIETTVDTSQTDTSATEVKMEESKTAIVYSRSIEEVEKIETEITNNGSENCGGDVKPPNAEVNVDVIKPTDKDVSSKYKDESKDVKMMRDDMEESKSNCQSIGDVEEIEIQTEAIHDDGKSVKPEMDVEEIKEHKCVDLPSTTFDDKQNNTFASDDKEIYPVRDDSINISNGDSMQPKSVKQRKSSELRSKPYPLPYQHKRDSDKSDDKLKLNEEKGTLFKTDLEENIY